MFKEVKEGFRIPRNIAPKIQKLANKCTKNDTYEHETEGLLLIMNYHAPSSSFIGVVENTTNQKISKISVEIYLSSAVELGPTKPIDLQPGEMKNIALLAYNQEFKEWNVVIDFNK